VEKEEAALRAKNARKKALRFSVASFPMEAALRFRFTTFSDARGCEPDYE